MIHVINKDYQVVKVEKHLLDSLIASHKIIAFYRSDECVFIDKDEIRKQYTYYAGEERRNIIRGNGFYMK
jgi:hypothetical protein